MERIINRTTKNLSLKTFTTADVTQEYINALNDYTVVKYTEARHHKWDRESVDRYIRESNIKGQSELIGIFLRNSGKHIGNIRLSGMNAHHKRVDLGILIHDKTFWSKGIGTEAIIEVADYVFNELELHKICADYYSVNHASARMFNKAGFQVEGVYKDHFLFENGYVDSIRVGLVFKPFEKSEESAKLKIPSAGPSITYKEIELVTEAVTQGWYTNMNMHLDQFVKEFTEYSERKYILPTSSCTVAIHLALLALGIGPGDEVIVPDISWVASAAPVHYVRGIPVFADIDPKTWCLTAETFEAKISDRTKAVVVVDLLGGMPSDMDKILKIAHDHDILVIEDVAEGLGTEYRGKKAGVFGDISVYSFNATKLVIGGQGGVIATDNKNWYEKFKLLQHHGIDRAREGKYYWSYEIGYNYQWTNMQSALTLAQLRRIEELIENRRQRGMWYKERLEDLGNIHFNYDKPPIKNSYWIVTAIYDKKFGITKEKLMKKFKKYNIDLRPFFYPISSMPAYTQYCEDKDMEKINPISYSIAPYGICFPSAMSVTESEVNFVCEKFKEVLFE
ncbi:MAG: bifunctional GNAT family N-acetyltransferase/PLP-dependent aspartate aminotransferase family protein [Candidatus Hodarchaeota archaeon]